MGELHTSNMSGDGELLYILRNDIHEASSFATYLRSRFQEQYLEFWLLAEEFKMLTVQQRADQGKEIYKDFFTDKSTKFLNMEEMYTMGLQQGVEQNSELCFSKPQTAAWRVLLQSYTTYISKSKKGDDKKKKRGGKKKKKKKKKKK